MSQSKTELKDAKKLKKASKSCLTTVKVEKKKKRKEEKKRQKKLKKEEKKLKKERKLEYREKKAAKKALKSLKKKNEENKKDKLKAEKENFEIKNLFLDANGNEFPKMPPNSVKTIPNTPQITTSSTGSSHKSSSKNPSSNANNTADPIFAPAAIPDDDRTVSAVPVRKPVSIRIPGLFPRPLDINPIYNKSSATHQEPPQADSLILKGVNDSEESRLLVKTFADKWYLPANLHRIEIQTGLKYRRGRFSEDEKELAKRLTLKFCHDQGMTLDQFKRVFFDEMGSRENHSCSSKRLSTFFVDVSQHFGGRPVGSVYESLKRIYHPGNHRGPWTPEEDEILLQEFEKHGPKWTVIGKELNRLGINCRDRYNLRWKNSDKIKNGTWSKEEESKLSNGVTESLSNSGAISWIWVSEERVKTRTPLQCLAKYKTLAARGTASRVKKVKSITNWKGWKSDEDFMLIHAILETGLNSESMINWRFLKIEAIPACRNDHEMFFKRWNLLKNKAGIKVDDSISLKNQVETIKKYLSGILKSAPYIFSEDDEEF